MAYRIYEVDGITGDEALVIGEAHTDSAMAIVDRGWLIKAQEEEWMRTGNEITKYYQIREVQDEL
jgi:hypothetical protein